MKPVYAIKDTAIQAFGNLITMRAPGEMMRGFQDEVNSRDGQSAIAKHPEDYELYKVADYDDLTGTLQPHAPELVARAKDLIQPTN